MAEAASQQTYQGQAELSGSSGSPTGHSQTPVRTKAPSLPGSVSLPPPPPTDTAHLTPGCPQGGRPGSREHPTHADAARRWDRGAVQSRRRVAGGARARGRAEPGLAATRPRARPAGAWQRRPCPRRPRPRSGPRLRRARAPGLLRAMGEAGAVGRRRPFPGAPRRRWWRRQQQQQRRRQRWWPGRGEGEGAGRAAMGLAGLQVGVSGRGAPGGAGAGGPCRAGWEGAAARDPGRRSRAPCVRA